MPDESFEDDLRTIWREQPTEGPIVTLEEIRQKARELHARTRRELLGSIIATLITVAFSGYGILHAHRLFLDVFAIAIVWSLAGQYYLRRRMWTATNPENTALITGLEFYRREIERRHDVFHRVLQWSYGPMILSIVAFIAMLVGFAKDLNRPVTVVLPFCIAFFIWMVGIFVQRSRGQRELQREIDLLRDIDREGAP